MKYLVLTLTALGLTLVSASASAEDKNVITLKQTDVVGNARRPTAGVEVVRARMRLPAPTPTLLSATKIHDATKKEPF
jgi:hypothetical protein